MILVPAYQETFWKAHQPSHGYTIRHIKVNLHLTDIEAAVVKQQPDYLHEVLLFAQTQARGRNPRTNQSELLRTGLHDVITIVPDEPAPEEGTKKK
jgi:hypothetical protein